MKFSLSSYITTVSLFGYWLLPSVTCENNMLQKRALQPCGYGQDEDCEENQNAEGNGNMYGIVLEGTNRQGLGQGPFGDCDGDCDGNGPFGPGDCEGEGCNFGPNKDCDGDCLDGSGPHGPCGSQTPEENVTENRKWGGWKKLRRGFRFWRQNEQDNGDRKLQGGCDGEGPNGPRGQGIDEGQQRACNGDMNCNQSGPNGPYGNCEGANCEGPNEDTTPKRGIWNSVQKMMRFWRQESNKNENQMSDGQALTFGQGVAAECSGDADCNRNGPDGLNADCEGDDCDGNLSDGQTRQGNNDDGLDEPNEDCVGDDCPYRPYGKCQRVECDGNGPYGPRGQGNSGNGPYGANGDCAGSDCDGNGPYGPHGPRGDCEGDACGGNWPYGNCEGEPCYGNGPHGPHANCEGDECEGNGPYGPRGQGNNGDCEGDDCGGNGPYGPHGQNGMGHGYGYRNGNGSGNGNTRKFLRG